ncbi:hypothetical protein [Streptomyces buecherae]|uniref:hypothetical protein n=1 Tax=Streptomyces buecherae TaxID=2763006 RepID=UPI003655AC5D
MVAVGCSESSSSGDSSDAAKKPQKTVLPQRLDQPHATDPQELTDPPETAPFPQQLAHELRKRTLKMAYVDGKTTAHCPASTGKKGAKVTCTTTYEGHEIEWHVTIGDEVAWMGTVEYEATPSKGILTRDGVSKLLFGNHRDSIDYALCNNIPKVALVPLDEKTSYECEVVLKGEEPTGLATLPVRATEAGPRAF